MLMECADGRAQRLALHALLLALELGVLRSALGSTARGHDQVHVPCILLFKHKSVGYCLLVRVVRQGSVSQTSLRARLPSYPHTKGKEFNILYYLIVLYCQENKLLFY